MSTIVRFPKQFLACENPKGELLVYVDESTGLFALDHLSRSGDSVARLGSWTSRELAWSAARSHAAATGCDFPQGRRA